MNPATVQPFLMFQGDAEAAVQFYVSLFGDGAVTELTRFGAEAPGKENLVRMARFTIGGQTFLCNDSPIQHAFTFTPAISLFVTCTGDEEIERLASALSEGGSFLMPLDSYGFSRRFAWVSDRFGVSWQLNLP